jgi:hypothetical protein
MKMTSEDKYISVKTGNTLARKSDMFYFRGTSFSGLVDEDAGALYDDPEDSFAARVGMVSSIDKGLIARK